MITHRLNNIHKQYDCNIGNSLWPDLSHNIGINQTHSEDNTEATLSCGRLYSLMRYSHIPNRQTSRRVTESKLTSTETQTQIYMVLSTMQCQNVHQAIGQTTNEEEEKDYLYSLICRTSDQSELKCRKSDYLHQSR